MGWEEIEGHWPQLTGQAKAQWDRLSGQDLHRIAGRRDRLADHVQARYGLVREDAEQQVQAWADQADDSWLN